MNKTGLARQLAARHGDQLTPMQAVDAVLDGIGRALADGRAVTIAGFGRFETPHQAARPGRNPSTGDTVTIPARRGVRFKPSPRLLDAVRNPDQLGERPITYRKTSR